MSDEAGRESPTPAMTDRQREAVADVYRDQFEKLQRIEERLARWADVTESTEARWEDAQEEAQESLTEVRSQIGELRDLARRDGIEL